MSFLSSLFSVDKQKKISDLKSRIQAHKRTIEIIKTNMAQYRAIGAPQHYQEGGKKNIAITKNLIASCKTEISKLEKG